VAQLLDGSANADGAGLLLRGEEFQPRAITDFEPLPVHALLRLCRLAETVGAELSDCPDLAARRSAAVLAARAHPVRVAFDE
jgi:hypothetical protein